MRWGLTISAALFLSATTQRSDAQSLRFEPQRVTIQGRQASAVLTVTNSGKTPGSYRIEMVDLLYGDDGSVRIADKTPANFPSAKSLIRFSPSQVRLEAGETQKVRVLVKTDTKIQDGEYRVHARIAQLPNVANVKEPTATKSTVVGVIGVSQAVAIPIIVRRGQTSATGSISSIKLAAGKAPIIDLQLSRTGNASLYTNLILKDKAGKIAAEVKGVALPVPNSFRRYMFPLEKLSAGTIAGGAYTLEMVDHDTGAVIDKKPVK